MTTSMPTFNFLVLLIYEIKRVSQNLMWGLLARCRTPYAENFTCAQCTWQGLTACQISHYFSIVSLCIMQLCEYVFCIGFPLYVPKNGVFGGFEGEDVVLWPPKGTTLREYASVDVSRVKSVQRPEL